MVNFDLDNYNISTQEKYNYGRPDIQIEDKDHIILIENKISADFTPDQIKRYMQILIENYDNKKKHLVLLSPQKNQSEYLEKICKQLGIEKIEKDQLATISNVEFHVITWDQICSFLQSNDVISSHLIQFMNENFLYSEKLEGEEMMIMNSDTVPMLLNKIWNVITSSRQFLSERKYTVTRMSQSKNQFLYYVEFEWGNICIQYFTTFWMMFNSPFALQINLNRKRTAPRLERIGYKYDENYGYICPVVIESEEIEKAFNSNIVEILKKD